MNFIKFWAALQSGGKTEKGYRYQIVDKEKLHILSQGNKNRVYYIKKETVRRYVKEDIPNIADDKFRSNHSYFMNVYNYIKNLKIV